MRTGLLQAMARRAGRWPLLPAAVMVLGLAGTALLTAQLRADGARDDRARLEGEARQAAGRLEAKLAAYEDVLLAGASLFGASREVDAAEWRGFIEGMRVQQRYPGFRSIGFAAVVPERELDAFAATLGPGGSPVEVHHVPGFAPAPGGAAWVVQFVEPLEPNRTSLGLRFDGAPAQREAALTAAASGAMQMTSTVKLVRDGAPGFILFVPVYGERPVPLEPERRAAATVGWVFAVFSQDEFYRGALGSLAPEVEIAVFDDGTAGGGPLFATGGPAGRESEVRRVVLGGRVMRLEVRPGAAFPRANAALADVTAGAGVLLALLGAAIAWLLQTWKRRAEGLAERRTQELAEALAFQNALVDGTGLAIIATDGRGRITRVNPAAEALLGRPAAELLALATIEELESEGTGRGFRGLVELLPPGGNVQREWRYRRPDGRYLQVWVAISALPAAEGDRPAGFVFIGRDVTAERAAERDRDRLFEYSLDMLAIVTAKGRFKRVSPAWERTLGWKPEELLGQSLWHFVHPEERGAQIARAQAVLEGRDAHDLRGRFRHADGSWRWVSFNASAVTEDESYIVARDITDIVRAEEEMAEAMEVLRANALALEEQAQELDRLRVEAEYLANHDALTGALNRRAWFHQAAVHTPTAIAIFDIDYFKQINDTYGHPAGDVVLREVARRLEAAVGEAGVVGRIGGEEFAVFFTVPAGEAREAALRCIGEVSREPVAVSREQQLRVTVSGGFAPWQEAPEDRPLDALSATYEAADRALYRAKEAGRHRLAA
ncbi:PAS domain S-box protein [Tepidiforma flava]|uniref:PAS domain S-box protein n=1 Tax=Tepidiforma flava TaxID=3004094 RepID=A0ABY7ME76_9CHLR|nr:PAS domain S-box protein [Tepidiforma flava]WBL37443.1 PAS domain S-box protein [Tepidiforma flava]